MPFFALSSKDVAKEVSFTHYYRTYDLSEKHFLPKCKFGGFFLSLTLCYLKFLLFRFNNLLNLNNKNKSIIYRQHFCINKYFKHILVVEWGFYNDSIADGVCPLQTFHVNNTPEWMRVYSTPEYDCSDSDFSNPIHKTDYCRTLYRHVLNPPHVKLSSRFFFNFFVLLPVDVSGHLDFSFLSLDDRRSKPPMQIAFPVLFELFLLKFNFCCFLFSNSLSSIYEFYSLGFLKSFIFRFYNIWFIWVSYYFNKLFSFTTFLKSEIEITIRKSFFSNLVTFYSLKCFDNKYVNSSLFYHILLRENLKLNLAGKLKIFNFIFKNLLFILLLFYSYNSLLSLKVNPLDYLSSFYSIRIYFFLLLLLSIFFIFIFRKFLINISSFDVFLSYLIQSIFSTFLLIIPGLISYLILLKILIVSGSDFFFSVLVITTLSFFLFSLLDKLHNAVWLYFTRPKSSKISKIWKSPSTPVVDDSTLVMFFPVLLIPIFLISKILLDSLVLICSLANLYTPDLNWNNYKSFQTEYNTFSTSGFRVPFYEITFSRFCYPISYDSTNLDFSYSEFDDPNYPHFRNPLIFFPKRFNINNIKFNLENPYFFKFLINGEGKLVEHQYNFLEINQQFNNGFFYKDSTTTIFPNRFVYYFIILSSWFFFFITNIKNIVIFNLSAFGIFKPRNHDYGVLQEYLSYKDQFIYINIDFNKFNLFRTTYKIFDIFYYTF